MTAEDSNDKIADLATRSPGSDPEDPYEGVVISELPVWWQRAIEEFDSHGLRPYRPPRFEDGVLQYTVVENLEEEYNVEIRFIDFNPTEDDFCEVVIEDESIGQIEWRRSPDGYTVIETDSDEFRELVENHLASGR